jgi:hypothetical protein
MQNNIVPDDVLIEGHNSLDKTVQALHAIVQNTTISLGKDCK